jgi:hypothetical protein
MLADSHKLGLFVSHDGSRAVTLAGTTLNDVNSFVKGLTKEGETKLAIWNRLKVVIKDQELGRYSARLRSATVHLVALQQRIVWFVSETPIEDMF